MRRRKQGDVLPGGAAEPGLDAVLDRLPVGLLLCDAELRPVAANAELYRIVGGTRPEDLQGFVDRILSGYVRGSREPYPPAKMPLLAALRGQPAAVRDLEVTGEGPPATLDLRAAPITGEGGEVTHVVATVADVTHERFAEDHVLLLHAIQSVNLLGAGAARRFGDVTATILEHARSALAAVGPDHPAGTDLTALIEAGEGAMGIVRDLLVLAGPRDDTPEPASVAELLEVVARLLAPLLAIAGVKLVEDVAPEVGDVHAHTDIAHQIVLELVKNSVDALSHGGEVRLTAGVTSVAAEGDHPILPAGRYLTLTVADDGSGIPLDVETRVFEPFFSTKAPGVERGHGLSSVYGWVKTRGGFINLDTLEGVGTTITVYLPA